MSNTISYNEIKNPPSVESIRAIEYPKYKAVVPRNCFDEDKKIKELDIRIADLTKKMLEPFKITGAPSLYGDMKTSGGTPIILGTIHVLKTIREEKKLDFNNWNCVNEIEKTKLVETREILSEGLDDYDEDVLKQTAKQQNLMLFVGGGIILIGLLLVLKFTKK